MSEGEMWKRQKSLNLNVPQKVVIIGAGGIGSWIAYFFARLGVKELVVADPDIVELHNLNRTPFNLEHINRPKVEALEEIILSFRDDIEYIGIPEYVLDWREEFEGADVIIDARDTTELLPFDVDFKLTYDGEMISFWIKPNKLTLIGDDSSGYETVPSYVVPPVVIASFLVHTVAKTNWKELQPDVETTTISELIKMMGVRI